MSHLTRTSSARFSSASRIWTPSAALPPKHPKTPAEGSSNEDTDSTSAPKCASPPMIGGGASSAPAECASSGSESGTDSSEHFYSSECQQMMLDEDGEGIRPTPESSSSMTEASQSANTALTPLSPLNADSVMTALTDYYGSKTFNDQTPGYTATKSILTSAFAKAEEVTERNKARDARFQQPIHCSENESYEFLQVITAAFTKHQRTLMKELHRFLSAHHSTRKTDTLKGKFLALTAGYRKAVMPPKSYMEFTCSIEKIVDFITVLSRTHAHYLADHNKWLPEY